MMDFVRESSCMATTDATVPNPSLKSDGGVLWELLESLADKKKARYLQNETVCKA